MGFRYLPRNGEVEQLRSLEELDSNKKYYIFRGEEIHYGYIQISDSNYPLVCERCRTPHTIPITPDFLILEP